MNAEIGLPTLKTLPQLLNHNLVLNSVFERYGANSVENLNSCVLPEVFSELYAIEADLD